MATYESRRYNTPVPDASKIADGSVNNTEFEHLDGVTSDIQTQLTSKLPLAGGTMSGNLDLNDNVRLRAGDSQDFEFFHDSSNSYIKNGTLKAHKIGGYSKRRHWRIKTTDLESFINNGGAGQNTLGRSKIVSQEQIAVSAPSLSEKK